EVLAFLVQLSERPILLALIGVAFTALMHSSAAMIIIGITFVTSDVLTLSAVLPLVIGANVGDTFPILITTFAPQSEVKKLAIYYFLFKRIRATISMLLFVFITDWVEYLPGSPERQIANFHTLLNIAIALLFVPFLPWIAKIFRKLLPQQELESS